MLKRFSGAANWSPTLEWFVLSGFPVNELSEDADMRFDSETERGLVFKPNFDLALSVGIGQFNELNRLASCLREAQHALSLRDSHDAPLVCVVVRNAPARQRSRIPFCAYNPTRK